MKYRKFWQSGLFLILVVSAAMLIVFSITLVLLFQSGASPGNARMLAIGLGIVLMLLGCGGMAVLLQWGKRTEKRLACLEELTLPLAKKDYPELAVLTLDMQDNADTEAYAELEKAERELGLFIQSFKTHTLGIVELDALFSKTASALGIGDAEITKGVTTGVAEVLQELEASIDKAEAAVCTIENNRATGDSLNHPGKALAKGTAHQSEQAEQSEQLMVKLLDESGALLDNLKTQINDGHDQSQTTYDTIKAASKELDKIIEMAGVINTIAEQSNILSMNAAIESAHAGTSGAGFAVVADEIRKLADSTSENASSIQSVLRSITQQIRDALTASQTSSQTFVTLNSTVENFAGSLGAAEESTRKVLHDRQNIQNLPPEVDTASMLSDSVSHNLKDVKALLNDLRTLCTKAKVADEERQKVSAHIRHDLGASLATFRDYLKEAENLDRLLAGDSAKTAKSATPSTIPETVSSETTERALPPKINPVDNSWRKDVTVKTPPRTVF